MKLDLSALSNLQNANKKAIKPTTKEQEDAANTPKSFTQRVTHKEEATSLQKTITETATPQSQTVSNSTTQSNNSSPATNRETPSTLPSDAEPTLTPVEELQQFTQSLDRLKQLIDDGNPIRDATMEVIKRTQSAPHLSNFLYENEDAFKIALYAMRQLRSTATEKRSAYRKKKQEKQADENAFANIMSDFKL